uniref:Uncharacterized protein n=1 Tax=Peronospora matthiolae TaxID=2874970 RepID=A0AAV1TL72_9STRA
MKSEVTVGKWMWDSADKSSKDGSTQYPRTTLGVWMGVDDLNSGLPSFSSHVVLSKESENRYDTCDS